MYILCSVGLGKNIQNILLALKCSPLKLIKSETYAKFIKVK